MCVATEKRKKCIRYKEKENVLAAKQWTGLHDIELLIHIVRNREAMENVIANIHQCCASEEEKGIAGLEWERGSGLKKYSS